jgi:hypothetical protein
MHLAVYADERPVRVDHRRGVVIDAGSAALEHRHDDHHAQLTRELLHAFGNRSRNRLRQVEAFGVVNLAEVRRVEQLLHANDLCAAGRSVADGRFVCRHGRIAAIRHRELNQTDLVGFLAHDAKT